MSYHYTAPLIWLQIESIRDIRGGERNKVSAPLGALHCALLSRIGLRISRDVIILRGTMKASIPRANVLDPKLRALVAKQQYLEALHYYRETYNASRSEAREALDLARAQLEADRERGAAPETPAVWLTPITTPQPSKNFVPPSDEPGPTTTDEDTEEEAESTSNETEPYSEDEPDENLNASPFALPLTFNPPAPESADEQEHDPDDDEIDDESDDDEPNDDESDEFDDDDFDDGDALEVPPENAPEASPPTPAAPVVDSLPLPTPAPVLAALSTTPPPTDIPVWESLPLALRRELSELSLEDAIRCYWREVGCSLSEAKAHVSFWFARR